MDWYSYALGIVTVPLATLAALFAIDVYDDYRDHGHKIGHELDDHRWCYHWKPLPVPTFVYARTVWPIIQRRCVRRATQERRNDE